MLIKGFFDYSGNTQSGNLWQLFRKIIWHHCPQRRVSKQFHSRCSIIFCSYLYLFSSLSLSILSSSLHFTFPQFRSFILQMFFLPVELNPSDVRTWFSCCTVCNWTAHAPTKFALNSYLLHIYKLCVLSVLHRDSVLLWIVKWNSINSLQ